MRSPTKVSALDSQHVEHVAAGNWHSTAIDSEGKCWQWGTGWKGTFGIQGQHFFSYPVENTQVSELCATMLSDGVRVSKLKSVNNCTMLMFDNGEVYGWGNNEEGILANNHIRGIFFPPRPNKNLPNRIYLCNWILRPNQNIRQLYRQGR
jgi:alpha-tubulin suppressor-like RCC1 family protein